MEGAPVACVSHAIEHTSLCKRGRLQCASVGLKVVRSPRFDGDEAGRVGTGTGVVVDPDPGLGNIAVYWPLDGDRTLWTRAGSHGMDVVVDLNAYKRANTPR